MIVDWEWWVLLLLFLIFILLLLLYLQFRTRLGKPPVVLFETRINVPCGHNDTIYANGLGPMDVNVELETVGQCEVTLNTPTRPGFLVRDGLLNKKGAAAIPLGRSETIFYNCKADAAEDAHCEFRIKITRI